MKLFKVATKRYTVGAEEFMLLHYDGDGNAVGLSREVYEEYCNKADPNDMMKRMMEEVIS